VHQEQRGLETIHSNPTCDSYGYEALEQGEEACGMRSGDDV